MALCGWLAGWLAGLFCSAPLHSKLTLTSPASIQAAPVVNAKDLPVIGERPKYHTFAEHSVAHVRTIHIGFFGQHLRVEVESLPKGKQQRRMDGRARKENRFYVFITRQKSLSINLVRILASIGSEVEILNEDAYSAEQLKNVFHNPDEQVKLYQYVHVRKIDRDHNGSEEGEDEDKDAAELSLLVVTNRKLYLCDVDFEMQARNFLASSRGASDAFGQHDEDPSLAVKKSQPLALLLSVGDKVDKVNTLTLWFKVSFLMRI